MTPRCLLAASVILVGLFCLLHPEPWEFGQGPDRLEMLTCAVFALSLLALHRFDTALMRRSVVRWFAWIGMFSYSLYLTHKLSQPLIYQVGNRLGLDGPHYWVSAFAQVAVPVLLARVFYSFFERPFMRVKASSAVRSEPAPSGAPRLVQPQGTENA